MRASSVIMIAILPLLVAAASSTAQSPSRWAIVLHGGAGSLPRDIPADRKRAYDDALARALDAGTKLLTDGQPAIDVVQAVVTTMEDDPLFNAGRGAVFTSAATHELDASIMDGCTGQSGAVTGVTRLKNPIHAARIVMDRSPHIFMHGNGAMDFAAQQGCQLVDPSYFFTMGQFLALQQHFEGRGEAVPEKPAYKTSPKQPAREGQPTILQPRPPADQATPGLGTEVSGNTESGNTVGCVALDLNGNLAAATSTGGLTGKLPGRIGDSPIIGAGTFANTSVAVSGTGKGEKYIQHSIAARVAWLVESGEPPSEAVLHCLVKVLKPSEGGLIALDTKGNAVALTNTVAMPHAIADSSGTRVLAIWPEKLPAR